MADIFTFDEKEHAYTLNGEKVTGVTSILEVVGDKRALIQWAADKVVEQFGWFKQERGSAIVTYREGLEKAMFEPIRNFSLMPFKDQLAFVLKARTAHTQRLKSTGKTGKDIHKEVEDYIKWCIDYNKGFATSVGFDVALLTPQLKHFLTWATKNKVKFLASEQKLYSKKYWYAGTTDIIMEMGGKRYIGDVKTTNYVWGRAYYAQIAAYRLAYCEMMGLNEDYFQGSVVVRLGRDGEFNESKDVTFSNQYLDDRRFFLAALEIYRQENQQFGTHSFDEKEMFVDLSKLS